MTNPELNPGQLVRYYLEGWRTGHVEAVKGNLVTIRPISARKGPVVRVVKVSRESVEVV